MESTSAMCKATWKQVLATNTPKRSSHGVSVVQNAIYLFGGELEPRIPADSEIYKLDLTSDTLTWECVDLDQEKSMPAPRARIAHAQTAVHDRYIYVFGGREGITMDEAPLNDLYCFDVETRAWTLIEPKGGVPPSSRSFHKMDVAGNTLFVFGGCGAEGRLADLHSFNLETLEWKQHEPCADIAGRGGAVFASSFDESKLIVAGGFSGEEKGDIYMYDLGTGVWEPCTASMLVPTSVASFASFPFGLVIFGGEVDPSQAGHLGAGSFTNEVSVFNDKTTTVDQIQLSSSEKPIPRGWSCGTRWNEAFVVVGGLTGDDANPQRLDDVWILEIMN